MVELSVIIPAYLEEENLRLILPRLRQILNQIAVSNEILIIDTQMPMDKTAQVCAEYNACYMNRIGGNTYGSAVRTGIAHSQGKHIIMMDADGSHPPEFITDLYFHVNDADIVIASRYVGGGSTENPASLIFLSHCLNMIYSLFLNIKCKDVSNSFKLYNGDKLREIKLECNNFDIIEEILVYFAINNKNCRLLEIPFVFKKRLFGRTKRNLLLFIATFSSTLVRLCWMKFFYRYKKQ